MAAASGLILLTGAAGFVGRQVLRALRERGCRVRPVVRAGKQETLARDAALETIVASPRYLRGECRLVGACVP